MTHRTVWVLLGFLCLAGTVSAMSSPNYAINWNTLGSGGGSIGSASYQVQGTVGLLAGVQSSASYTIYGGFWMPALGPHVFPPVANFTNTTPRIGTGPLTVTFQDTSTNTPTSWSWAYKNGTGSWTQFSAAQNPAFAFPTGAYDINLTATNAGGSDDEIKAGFVVASSPGVIPPVANFTNTTPRIGTGPLTVTFQDTSTNTPTSWSWAYKSSNGSWTRFSTAQDPTYTFPVGTYAINLTATNAGGSDDEVKTAFVVASAPPTAPTVTSITPDTGVSGTTVTVTDLHGTNFVSEATVKLARSGMGDIVASSVEVVSADRITCTLGLPPGSVTGAWNVVVTNPDALSGTLTGGFTITAPPTVLSVTKISPAKHRHGGKAFTAKVNGTGFQPGVFGTGVILWKTVITKNITGSGVTVQSGSGLTTKFRIPKNAKTGWYNLTVFNPDGQRGTLAKGFKILT